MKKSICQSLIIGSLFTGCFPPFIGCIASGARVLTPKGQRLIDDLKVGDIIYSIHEETGKLECSPILNIVSVFREVGQLKLSGGTLDLTTDHPVYDPSAKEYAPAGDWLSGHRTALATYEGELRIQQVMSSQVFVSIRQVFDLTVESTLHNFIANGVVVHNKTLTQDYDPICHLDSEMPLEPGDNEAICKYRQLQVATEVECSSDDVSCVVIDLFDECGPGYSALCRPEVAEDQDTEDQDTEDQDDEDLDDEEG